MPRILIALVLLLAVARADSNDWLIVPGQRVGPITRATTRADLTRFFGEANLKDEKIHLVEGEYGEGTWVYPRDAKKKLAVVWKDKSHKQIELVKITGSNSAWHTATGITLGTRLKQLETINGKPFSFSGFGWDYGGNVTGWNGGTLDKPPYNFSVRLSEDTARFRQLPQDQQESVMGDQELWSNAAVPQKVDPWVGEMIVSFAR